MQKNFVTYQCTLEHEKVHVVQRDEAINKHCPALVRSLSEIRAKSEEEANRLAQASVDLLKAKVFAADSEDIPYQIEWKCNEELAMNAKVRCSARPDWNEYSFLRGLNVEEGLGELKFMKDDKIMFVASFIDDATRLESATPFDTCQKKQWFFSANRLTQENCVRPDGITSKKFYLFGKLQREIKVGAKGEKLKEKILIDPKERITQD